MLSPNGILAVLQPLQERENDIGLQMFQVASTTRNTDDFFELVFQLINCLQQQIDLLRDENAKRS